MVSKTLRKFSIGTANFGLEYGLKNRHTKLGLREVRGIINLASEMGISAFDSALEYGDAQATLCNYINEKIDFTTKFHFKSEMRSAEIKTKITNLVSFGDITLLLHNSHNLTASELNDALKVQEDLKGEGLVSKIGLSLYDPRPLDLLDSVSRIDVVQYPLSCFDRRMERSGWVQELQKHNISQVARSIFLQGILLENFELLPAYFKQWETLFNEWQLYLKKSQQTAYQACLNHVVATDYIDKIIIGVDSRQQLLELQKHKFSDTQAPLELSAHNNNDLLDPFRWQVK